MAGVCACCISWVSSLIVLILQAGNVFTVNHDLSNEMNIFFFGIHVMKRCKENSIAYLLSATVFALYTQLGKYATNVI